MELCCEEGIMLLCVGLASIRDSNGGAKEVTYFAKCGLASFECLSEKLRRQLASYVDGSKSASWQVSPV